MRPIAKGIVLVFCAFIGVSLAMSFVKMVGGNSASSPASTPPPVTEITKEQYLDIVRRNCPGNTGFTTDECVCFYSDLIDEYGVDEVRLLDIRAAKDPDFTDDRLFDAVYACMEGL